MSIEEAIKKLGEDFSGLNWAFLKKRFGENEEIISYWPGDEDEDLMVCVLKAKEINEEFHRQDFFFINFAYKNSYNALSANSNNLITINENECYIGQPYSGYALRGDSEEDIVIIGILIKKDVFIREFLLSLSTDNSIFHFFLEPQNNVFSDDFLHLSFDESHSIRTLFEMLVLEYAEKKEDTQALLKPITLSILMYIAREYRNRKKKTDNLTVSEQIISYINENLNDISLKKIARRFSYHPNYVSTLLHRETGMSFSELLLKQRMERAIILLERTDLTIEEIAPIVGYNNNSNFYRTFHSYFKCSPRKYLREHSSSL